MSNSQVPTDQWQRGWYERGYVPHFDGGPIPQTVTFRLIDSFPKECLEEWSAELASMPPAKAEEERRRRIERYLDKGRGSAWLSRPDIADIIRNALLYFNEDRYLLHAWVVMPNHVHVLLTARPDMSLAQLLHSWKSFTATKANTILGRGGPFWQKEFFDRFVRDQNHFEAAIRYIEHNPVKAGLCDTPAEWSYSSACARTSTSATRVRGTSLNSSLQT